MTTAYILFNLILSAMLLIICRKQTHKAPPLNPLTIVALFYLGIAFIGYYSYSTYLSSESSGGASIAIAISKEELTITLNYYLSIINALLAGAVTYNFLRSIILHSMPVRLNKALRGHTLDRVKPNFKVIIIVTLFPQACLFFGIGADNIINSTNYLTTSIPILRSAGNMLMLPAAIILGHAYAVFSSRSRKTILILITILGISILFSLATRSIAFFLPLFTLGYSVGSQSHTQNSTKINGSVAILATLSFLTFFPLLYIPLYLRGLDNHGLFPYISGLLLIQPEDYLSLFEIVLNNILVSFPLTFAVMTEGSRALPLEYLLTALNPLPGFLTNWNEISHELRLNPATPYNALGEAYLYGGSAYLGLFFSIGSVVMFITNGYVKCLTRNRVFIAIIMLGLCFGFAIISAQYNLRSSVRFVYYALAICMISDFIFPERNNSSQ